MIKTSPQIKGLTELLLSKERRESRVLKQVAQNALESISGGKKVNQDNGVFNKWAKMW